MIPIMGIQQKAEYIYLNSANTGVEIIKDKTIAKIGTEATIPTLSFLTILIYRLIKFIHTTTDMGTFC